MLSGNRQTSWYDAQAVQYVIQQTGSRDPAGVLALARAEEDHDAQLHALVLVAPFQPKEVALQILREAAHFFATAGDRYPVELARIARTAYPLDPQAGSALFTQALSKAQTNANDALIKTAYYGGHIDEVTCRETLEAYYRRDPQAPQAVDLIMAMAAVDPSRALAMSSKINDKATAAWVRRSLLRYLLTPPATRNTLPYNWWNNFATDVWLPDKPMGW